MRRTIGFALLLAGAVTASASDITIRNYRSDDTLLRIGLHAFEEGAAAPDPKENAPPAGGFGISFPLLDSP